MFEEHVVLDEHPTKGWNRASIIFWSRKPYRPRLSEEDTELPHGGGPEILVTSAVAGTLVSLTLGWFALLLVSLYRPLSGRLSLEILAAAAVAMSASLYAVAALRGRGLG